MGQPPNIVNKDLELRCQCSRLLFKKLNQTLEVKCPRCKRIHTFTLAQLTAFLQAGNFCALHTLSSEARDPESNAHKTRKENA
jgi:phage FluMu protein Com